jgi:hypothetical protein
LDTPLTSSGHYNASAARPAAFLPNPKNGETSVFRHGAEPFEALKSIAQAEVGVDRRIHGAAIVKASVIREAKLEVRAKEPPPRHADIIGWCPPQGLGSTGAGQDFRASLNDPRLGRCGEDSGAGG